MLVRQWASVLIWPRGQHLDAQGLEAEAGGVGLAAGGDEDDVGVEACLAVVLAQLVGDGGARPCDLSTPCTAAPRMNFRPCLVRMRWKVLATSASMPGVMASRYSTTVTSVPRRA